VIPPPFPRSSTSSAAAQPARIAAPFTTRSPARVLQGRFQAGSLQAHGATCTTAIRSGLLDRAREGGAPLPEGVRAHMEAFFDADFSAVRVHLGPEPRQIGAVAFTVGTDVFFSPEQYAPHTPDGLALLGHELTHVVQQRDGRVPGPAGGGLALVQIPELEAEADHLGRLAALGGSVQRARPRTPTPF
jgi:hypothetical protein